MKEVRIHELWQEKSFSKTEEDNVQIHHAGQTCRRPPVQSILALPGRNRCRGHGRCRRFAKRIIDNAPEVTPESVKPQGYATSVYADDGTTQIQELVTSGSNRVYKTIDEIPKDLQHAFVAIEDERFL